MNFHEVYLGIASASVPPAFIFLNTSPRPELVYRYGMYNSIQIHVTTYVSAIFSACSSSALSPVISPWLPETSLDSKNVRSDTFSGPSNVPA